MTDFLKQRKKENEANTFSVWMRKQGTQSQNTFTPDKAAAVRARSTPTHGAAAEALYEKGLQKSGYAQYLADEADRSFNEAKRKYEQDAASAMEKNLSGYARYLSSHEEAQATLRKQMIDRIGKGESFDAEAAYQAALATGLTDENARAAAALGVAAAKERASSRLLELILEQRLKDDRAMEYARSMGFSEDEVEKFGEYARKINSTKNVSVLPDSLFD